MSKQLLAKCAVFVLIVVNLGAYYMFWPDTGSSGAHAEKHEHPGNPLPIARAANPAQSGETADPGATQEEQVYLPSGAPAPEPQPIGAKEPTGPELPTIPDPQSTDRLP